MNKREGLLTKIGLKYYDFDLSDEDAEAFNIGLVEGYVNAIHDLRAELALYPCHVTGEHQYNHHDQRVCESQRSLAFQRLLTVLGVEEADLPHKDHENCELCKEYDGGWHDDDLLYHVHPGDAVYARCAGNRSFAWYVVDHSAERPNTDGHLRVSARSRKTGSRFRIRTFVEIKKKEEHHD